MILGYDRCMNKYLESFLLTVATALFLGLVGAISVGAVILMEHYPQYGEYVIGVVVFIGTWAYMHWVVGVTSEE